MCTDKKRLFALVLLWIAGIGVLAAGIDLFDMTEQIEANQFGLIAMLMVGALLLFSLGVLRALELCCFLNKVWVVAGFLVMPYVMVYLVQMLTDTPAEALSVSIFAWNYFWCLMVYVLLFALTNQYRISMVTGTVFLFLLGAVNYFVLDFRGTPFQVTDVLAIGTAADVAGSYDIVMNPLLLYVGTLAFFAMAVACVGRYYQCRVLCMNPVTVVGSVVIFAVAITSIGNFYRPEVWQEDNLQMNFWNPTAGYADNGTVLSLAMSAKYLRAEKPENYSPALAESIVRSVGDSKEKICGTWSDKKTSDESVEYILNKRKEAERASAEVSDAIIKAEQSEKNATQRKADIEKKQNTDNKSTTTKATDNNSLKDNLTGKTEGNSVNKSVNSSPKETVEEKQKEFKSEDVKPNIIAIMNESYADLSLLGDLQTKTPYMTFYNSLHENTIRGNLVVSVLGGGTCNTEFEFLTGLSMAFLPSGVMAFQQYITGETPSLATVLKEQGYDAIAFHPGKAESWRRNKVYPLLGFERFYTETDMDDPFYMRGAYISDSDDYQEIIRLFEEKDEDSKLFLFNVTIQNHGGYQLDTVGIPYWVGIKNLEGHYPQTEEYLSLMKASDMALEELITYFSAIEEPTLIVFFGDHQPSVETELVEELMGKTTAELNLEEVMTRYQVPFFIWANYDIEEDYYESISANYLGTLTLQTAGLELSPFMQYLAALEQQIPMVDALSYQTNNYSYHRFGEETEQQFLIEEYRLVQYNYLFGGRNRVNNLYHLPEKIEAITEEKS